MSKPAKIHKIKAKVDPKATTVSSQVAKKQSRQEGSAQSSKVKTRSIQSNNANAAVIKDKLTKEKTKVKSIPPAKKSQHFKDLAITGLKPLVIFNRYLKNSWSELKKVHWPSRKSTWAMVFAVVGYTLFLLVLVLMLDNFFSYIFKLMLK